MKNETEVRAALLSHGATMEETECNPTFLQEVAKNLGWTEEFTRGYIEGVEWAYKWVLEMCDDGQTARPDGRPAETKE